MKTNEIYTAEVSWLGGSKRRPVLIIEDKNREVSVFKITSKYENKSKYIKHFYYPIVEWKKSGLNKPSYIDTKTLEYLNKKDLSFHRVGFLTSKDKQRLKEFIRELWLKNNRIKRFGYFFA